MKDFNKLILEAKQFAIENMPKDILHGYPHIKRVLKYADMVNKEVHADWNIVQISVLLHDIGHKIRTERHNELSAEMAENFLKAKKINPEMILNIKNSILTHSRQFAKEKPSSLESKVVFDADGMDLFGPIGLMRALLSYALKNKEFDCIIKKLEWRISQIPNFYSIFAKNFVKENSNIIKNYLKELQNQIKML